MSHPSHFNCFEVIVTLFSVPQAGQSTDALGAHNTIRNTPTNNPDNPGKISIIVLAINTPMIVNISPIDDQNNCQIIDVNGGISTDKVSILLIDVSFFI